MQWSSRNIGMTFGKHFQNLRLLHTHTKDTAEVTHTHTKKSNSRNSTESVTQQKVIFPVKCDWK